MHKPIHVNGTAKVAGQMSHAVVANGFVLASGQKPAEPVTNVVSDRCANQVRQTLRNLPTILEGRRQSR